MCKVAQRIAAEFGVSEKTILRDAEFATALDYLGIREDILSGRLKLPKSKVITMYRQAIGKVTTDNRVGLYAKVSPETHARIASLAEQAGVDMGTIIEAMVQRIATN